MPVFGLSEQLVFPSPGDAEPDGLLAVGGDASPERLVLAYSQGIFPWPEPGYPLLWFSPDPRFVLRPAELHVSRSLRRTLARTPWHVRADTAFDRVVDACARTKRPGQRGTWITPALRRGFVALHEKGLAHSIETYAGDELVGGLYGMSLGGAFFGESMFATRPDASKVAFTTLVAQLQVWGIELIDCQVQTAHLKQFGARDLPRAAFLAELKKALRQPTRVGPWRLEFTPAEASIALGI